MVHAKAAAKVTHKSAAPHGKAGSKAKATPRPAANAAPAGSGLNSVLLGDSEEAVSTQEGVGSWYGKYFHGRQTASGELYNMHAYTAAHRTLPIPSFARVRNLGNGREVIVRINDRGPYVGKRVIDLSMAAAQRLGIQGLGRVRIEPVSAEAIHSGKWRLDDGRPGSPAELDAAVRVPETDSPPPGAFEPAASPPLPAEAAPADTAVPLESPPALEDVRTAAVAATVPDDHAGSDPQAAAVPLRADTDRLEPAHPPVAAPARGASRPRLAAAAHRDGSAAATSAVKDAPKEAKESVHAHAATPSASPGAEAAALAGPVLSAAASAAVAPMAVAALAPVSAAPVHDAGIAEAHAPATVAAVKPSSLFANVAATVTPVLTGLARSATGVKDTVVSLATPRAAKPGTVQIDPARTSNGRGWWLQLGAFDQSSNAMRFQHKVIDIAPWLGPLLGIFDEKGEQKLQAGPYPTREQAQNALERAREALKVTPVMVQRR